MIHQPVTELSKMLHKREISAVEIAQSYLHSIQEDKSHSEPLNAYTFINEDITLASAKEADQRLQKGDSSPLTGIPLGIKDIINIKGMPTTCASKMLQGFVAQDDATVIDRLVRKSGMVPLGKLNMDEFAMGSSNETSYYGVVRNPYDRSRTPGGSSGGSAAAVAGKLAPASLGTDTGGSIRLPAAFCGIVGLKPTYGRVSRYGAVAFGSSLDQIGPMTQTVEDAAMIFSAMAGVDPRDSSTIPEVAPKISLNASMKGRKVGILKEFFEAEFDSEIRSRLDQTIELLKKEGAEIVDISVPDIQYSPAVYYIVAPAEAAANLSRFDGIRYGNRVEGETLIDTYIKSRTEGFGTEVKRRIMLGTFILSSESYDDYFVKAQKVRTRLKQGFEQAFNQVDVILGPTAPAAPFKLGEKVADPIAMYLTDIFTISSNLIGNPAISVPVGFDSSGLPIGAQLIGKAYGEADLFNIAYAVEQFKL
ncbi:MAG: Asp-tRNA(Asn)/Glu-tRNA(Gln) amidotransferase subunit GatA [Brevinema sp.]